MRQAETSLSTLMHIKGILANCAEWLNEQWIVKSVALFLPTIWIQVILKILGKDIGLCDNNGSYTTAGTIGTIIVYSIFVLVTLLTGFKASRDLKRKKESDVYKDSQASLIDIYKIVSDGEISTEKNRIELMRNTLSKKKELLPEIRIFIQNTFSPMAHLAGIILNMKRCLLNVTSEVDIMNDLYVSMAISISGGEWEWINQADISGCADLSLLLNNVSTFQAVLNDGSSSYLYYNDKNEGIEKKQYVIDNKDAECKANSGKITGSIICWRIDLMNKKQKVAQAVLSISTYGQQLTQSTDESVIKALYEKIIKNRILRQFENEILLDMAFAYFVDIKP